MKKINRVLPVISVLSMLMFGTVMTSAGQQPYQQALGDVLLAREAELGSLSFTSEEETMIKPEGVGAVCAIDLDGDQEEELILVHLDYSSGNLYLPSVMEIWDYDGNGALLVYEGFPYSFGFDSTSLWIADTEDGSRYVICKPEGEMEYAHICKLENGQFVSADILDPAIVQYGDNTFIMHDVMYQNIVNQQLASYSGSPDMGIWKNNITQMYEDALVTFGLSEASAAKPANKNVGDDYRLKADMELDSDGQVKYYREYEYEDDASGNIYRTIRNGVTYRSYERDADGNVLKTTHYDSDGNPSEAYSYDTSGRELERIEYNNGEINVRIQYTYDDNGNLIYEDNALTGLHKEYIYSDSELCVEEYWINADGACIYSVNTEMDEQGRPVMQTVTLQGEEVPEDYNTWEYYEDGSSLMTETMGNRPVKEHRYDAEGREIELVVYGTGSDGEMILTGVINREYDENGNLIREDNHMAPDIPALEGYETDIHTYDEEGRKIRTDSNFINCYTGEEFNYVKSETEYVGEYRVHEVTREVKDSEVVVEKDKYYVYGNSAGEQIGMLP